MEIKQAETELAFIKKVMEDSKRITVDNGIGFIVWGLLGVLGIILTYADYFIGTGIGSLYIWIAVFAIGILYLVIDVIREGRKEKAKTLAGNLLGTIWITCLVAAGFMLLIPLFVKGVPASVTLTEILFIIGVGYVVTSVVFSYKWIRFIGYGWWMFGFLNMMLVFPHSQMIYLGFLLVFLQIVPGLAIYKKWKSEINQ